MSTKNSTSKIKLISFEELYEGKNSKLSIIPDDTTKMTPRTMNIPIKKLRPFKNHPFKVIHDAEMDDLIGSIKANGVIEPIIVRHDCENDMYEIIAGHRRTYAARNAGLKRIPAKIIDVDDDTATIYMVDSNMYREKVLPSEKAFSYRMKLEAIKHQGKKTSTQNVEEALSVDIIGDEHGESRETIRRYIRLTYLIPELLNMVDADKLKFVMAVDISYLTEEMQRWLHEDVMSKYVVKPAQITELRKQLQAHTFDKAEFVKFFELETNPISTPKQISTAKISKYFPPHYDKNDIERALETILSTVIVRKMLEEIIDPKNE